MKMMRTMLAVLLLLAMFSGFVLAERMDLGCGYEIELSDGYTVTERRDNGEIQLQSVEFGVIEISATNLAKADLSIEMLEGYFGSEWPQKLISLMLSAFGVIAVEYTTINGLLVGYGYSEVGYSDRIPAGYFAVSCDTETGDMLGVVTTENYVESIFKSVYRTN